MLLAMRQPVLPSRVAEGMRPLIRLLRPPETFLPLDTLVSTLLFFDRDGPAGGPWESAVFALRFLAARGARVDGPGLPLRRPTSSCGAVLARLGISSENVGEGERESEGGRESREDAVERCLRVRSRG